MSAPDTQVPPIVWTPQGPVLPAESDILDGRLADINDAFGGNLNVENLETPQGQLATSDAAIVADKNSQIALLANQVNPAFSSGRWQDAIGYIYFLERIPAQPTTVDCLCTGAAGTIIPVGALVVDTSGNKYACTEAGTIPVGGSITLPFACTVDGPTVCPSNSVTQVYQAITGWDTVNNSSAGVEGQLVESSQAFEQRRQASVAANSVNSVQSIKAAVLAVAGVLDCYCIDNSTNAPVSVGGITLPANSLYVAAVGGLASAVAQAIWSKKSAGCSYYGGNVSQTVFDTTYPLPQPSYTVTYENPTPVPIYVQVTLAAAADPPSNILGLVQQAVINAFAGLDGGPRARIGSTIYASRYYNPVAALGAGVEIVAINVGTAPTPTGNTVATNINQVPTVTSGDITVVQV